MLRYDIAALPSYSASSRARLDGRDTNVVVGEHEGVAFGGGGRCRSRAGVRNHINFDFSIEFAKAHRRALERALPSAVYSEGMFRTGNDADNRAVVAALPTAALNLVWFAVCGDRRDVDKALKDLRLHP